MDDQNPSQMQDDGQAEISAAQESNNTLNNVDSRLLIEDETEEQSPEISEEEVIDEEAEPNKIEEEKELPPEPEIQPSRRENKRILELTRKLQEANNQNNFNQPQQVNNNYQNPSQIIGEGDYDLDQVNELAQDYGNQRYNEGVKTAAELNNSLTFMTRLEFDAPKVEAKYDQFNPQSENFDPGIADYTNQLFYKTVGLKTKSDGTYSVENPNIRYSEFVEGLMEAVNTLASSKTADAKVNIAKQASQTGVRPNTVNKKVYQGTNPNEMTIEQLRQKVNEELGIS